MNELKTRATSCEIIGIGTGGNQVELLRLDMDFLQEELYKMGIKVLEGSVVGDNRIKLQHALSDALGRSDLIVILGGLDIRNDCPIKQLISEGLGLPMVMHRDSLKRIERILRDRDIPMTPEYTKEAVFPEDAVIFPNEDGIEQGFAITAGTQSIVILPVLPSELRPMFEGSVRPFLSSFFGIRTKKKMTVTIPDEAYYAEGPEEAAAAAVIPSSPPVPAGPEREPGRRRHSRTAPDLSEDPDLTSVRGSRVQADLLEEEPEQPDPPPEQKKGGKFGRIRIIVLTVAILVFVASLSYIGLYYYEAYSNRVETGNIQDIFSQGAQGDVEVPEDYPTEYLAKFAGLYAINEDVIGWIEVPGTQLAYPVVQTQEDDGQWYLRRDFYKKNNNHGIPFLDYRSDVRKPSSNLIIYGHNMKDGQMFGELLNYQQMDYYKQHPVITFDSIYEEGQYKIISVFITNAYENQGAVFDYHNFIDTDDEDAFMQFVHEVQIRSLINTPVDVEPGDTLLTLSTCTYEFQDARLVVVARRVRDGESVDVNVEEAAKNTSPLMPDIWYQLFGGTKPDVQTVVASGGSVSTNTPPLGDDGSDDGLGFGSSSDSGVSMLEPPSSSSSVASSTPPASSAPPSSSSAPASSSAPPASSAPESSSPDSNSQGASSGNDYWVSEPSDSAGSVPDGAPEIIGPDGNPIRPEGDASSSESSSSASEGSSSTSGESSSSSSSEPEEDSSSSEPSWEELYGGSSGGLLL